MNETQLGNSLQMISWREIGLQPKRENLLAQFVRHRIQRFVDSRRLLRREWYELGFRDGWKAAIDVQSNTSMNTEQPNHFTELLAVLKDEDLIRLRRRLEKKQNTALAQIMAVELEKRESAELARQIGLTGI